MAFLGHPFFWCGGGGYLLPLIVFREVKEFREFKEGSCVMYATLPKFP